MPLLRMVGTLQVSPTKKACGKEARPELYVTSLCCGMAQPEYCSSPSVLATITAFIQKTVSLHGDPVCIFVWGPLCNLRGLYRHPYAQDML